MKNETVKKGRIERLEKNGSLIAGLIFLLLLISLLYFSITTGVNLAFDGFSKVYSGYPNAKYEDLEKELSNIIVDNKYIDMERLSDPNIEFKKTHSKSNSYPAETWDITLKKNDIEVSSTIKKSEDGTLELKSMRDTSKVGFYINRTFALVGVIILCIAIAVIIWILMCFIYFMVLDILVAIQRKYIAPKAKSTVSKKDKS